MIAMTCVLLTACGSEIEGTYKFSSMTYNGVTINAGDTVEGYTYDADMMTITVNKDGTYEMSEGGDTVSGTWKQKEGDVYTITFEGESMDVTIKDGTMTFEMEGRTMVMKK